MGIWEKRVGGRGNKKGLQRVTRNLRMIDIEYGDAFTAIYTSQNFSNCIL